MKVLQVPQYMNKGSRGPHVTLLHAFLFGMGKGDGIVMDGHYGAVTASKVAESQRERGLEADGNFGPQTREMLERIYGLNFENACRMIPGTTVFIQPDGSSAEWERDA